MPKDSRYSIEVLNDRHVRKHFRCGVEALDRYLQTQAGQDNRRRIAACFVLTEKDSADVLGYYTLSATSIALTDLPSELSKRLPRYPVVPATMMGRLAVDSSQQGKKLGELLLMDAFVRALRNEIATFAFVVDAKDAAARRFYERFSMRSLDATGRRLFIPMAEIAKLFAKR